MEGRPHFAWQMTSSRKAKIRAAGTREEKLAPDSLPLRGEVSSLLLHNRAKRKGLNMRTRKDSPRLSPGKSKRIRNTAEACDLFNYNNPSKKIRIIF